MITSAFRVYEKGNSLLLIIITEIHPSKYDHPHLRHRDSNSPPKKKIEDHTPTKKKSIGRQVPSSQRQINPYNFGMPQNNININVNNLIINNNQNPNCKS